MTITNVSRRQFLGGVFSTGAFVLAARVLPESAWAQTPVPLFRTKADQSSLNPSVYLGIEPDGTVFIVTHRSEMGTGIRTTLPMVAADELDADWGRCRIEQGVGDARYGDQNTDGSRSVRDFYDAFRRAGASARTMLVSAAAAQWNVPAAQCVARNHEVIHEASGRRLAFGALVPAAAKLTVPKPEELQFKPKTAWRMVGKDTATYDQKDIVTGKAQFGLDVYREGMVYATIEHPPVLGGTAKSVDDKAALAVKGVQQTVALDTFKPPHLFQPLGGVAVIADSTWAAIKGRRALKVEWNDGAHAGFESEAFKQQMLATVKQTGKVFRNHGNVDAEFAKGGKVLEAMYYTPMAAHASMEPPAAVAEFNGGKATIWAPTQNPQAVQEAVSAALGIKKEDVICHVTLLGGGFGRKSKPDYAAEAAVLARKLGKPVKVIWTREDDIRFDYYHTTAAVYHKASVDAPRQADGVAASIGIPADRLHVRARRARATELRARSRSGRSAIRHPEHPGRKRTGRRARAHRMVPRRQQQLPRLCRAQLRRRDGAGCGPRFARVPARHAGPGQGARSQVAGCGLLQLRRAVRQIPDRHAPAAPRAGDGGREVGVGQAQGGRRMGHGYRRTSQLQQLRRLGRRGRGR